MLEVIATNLQDIKEINKSQADQIEFCIDIVHDGLTPSYQDISQAIKISQKKLRIMLRYHYDNFLMNKKQVNKIIALMQNINHLKFDGYVFGAINNKSQIDDNALNCIFENTEDKNLTFHKAFDHLQNLEQAFLKLNNYHQVKYVLTSGGPVSKPLQNKNTIEKLLAINSQKILLGGGVDEKVINYFAKIGISNYHIGRLARFNNSYQEKISFEKINHISQLIKNLQS